MELNYSILSMKPLSISFPISIQYDLIRLVQSSYYESITFAILKILNLPTTQGRRELEGEGQMRGNEGPTAE